MEAVEKPQSPEGAERARLLGVQRARNVGDDTPDVDLIIMPLPTASGEERVV